MSPVAPGTHRSRRRLHTPWQSVKRIIAAEVSERDEWTCKLCGQPVDPALVGSNAWDAPSMDHVVAFADGGTFEPDNLQLAHRLCNVQRAGHNVGRRLRAKHDAAAESLPIKKEAT